MGLGGGGFLGQDSAAGDSLGEVSGRGIPWPSVVVFDRVRELTTANATRPFAEVASTALLQTVPRIVNTGMVAVFIFAALALLGGDTLTDLALALLIGITVGICSSVFTATPLAIVLHHPSLGEHDRK